MGAGRIHREPSAGRRVTPQGKEILKGIWLSFLPGAKIGVLGANGAGKSTLLRIMAGVEKELDGEAFLAAGLTVGFLPQEPQLDPTRTVQQHVRHPRLLGAPRSLALAPVL